MTFSKKFARNYDKKNILGQLVVCPSNPATQRIVLKIVRFLVLNAVELE